MTIVILCLLYITRTYYSSSHYSLFFIHTLSISTHNFTMNTTIIQLSYRIRIWAHIYQSILLVHLHLTNFDTSYFFLNLSPATINFVFFCLCSNGNTKIFIVDFSICLQNGIMDYTSLLARVKKGRPPTKILKIEQEPYVFCYYILYFRYF